MKTFDKLNIREAGELVQKCVRKATSDDNLRSLLAQVGFDAFAAEITSEGAGETFKAGVRVRGPNGGWIVC